MKKNRNKSKQEQEETKIREWKKWKEQSICSKQRDGHQQNEKQNQ